MTFEELLRAVSAGTFRGIAIDSRAVESGELYVALRGERVDGHDFVQQALERGALAVVVEREVALPPGLESRAIVVENTRRALSPLAAAFHGDPSQALETIGVTGTNGKTTTTQMIAAIFEAAGRPCGTIGTIGARFGDREWPLENTTPQPPELHALFAQMRAAGAAAVAMEVSSHALALERVEDVRFAVGAFTNLTRDHLDFHGTTDAYAAAKRHLFELAERCVYNAEDPYGLAWARETKGAKPTTTYALSGEADVRPRDVAIRPSGSTFSVDGVRFTVHLPGRFNVSNALCAIACARSLGIDDATSARGLENVRRVPGRMESIPGGDVAVVVDYSHTPDSLENALTALREASSGALAVVFGCGGDRDRGKRPLMGAVAARLADRIYVTDDNPRTEDARAIRDEIVAGIGGGAYAIVADRREAIDRAIGEARAGDTVLIAGKGHENYQIVGTRVLPFDDAATAREALAARPAASR
jgi:UDP-N-acetylmuramoyl-L-alanyl-D-glutamate--2,6-diaminopimelate ligase